MNEVREGQACALRVLRVLRVLRMLRVLRYFPPSCMHAWACRRGTAP